MTIKRCIYTDFVSLVSPYALRFLGCMYSNFSTAGGPSFFSVAQNVIGLYLASPRVRNDASEGENPVDIYQRLSKDTYIYQ